jgi:lipoprotein NlpI
MGAYDHAIADYSRVLEIDRTNTHAFHNRGISYEKKGEYLLAVRDFTRGTIGICFLLFPVSVTF